MTELETDILIAGGGLGGTAAALAIARAFPQLRVVMTEPTDWVGGQLTSQAVPPDENRWIEEFGGTRSYQQLREAVRSWYRTNGRLADTALNDARLNPGNGWVSRLCAQPRVWHEVLHRMLAEHTAAGRLTIMLDTEPVSAECDRDLVRAVRVRRIQTGAESIIRARMVLDATELGDVLDLARVEHAVGAEHASVYGELHGRSDFDPAVSGDCDVLDQQACSWCFAIEHRKGENHVIPRPTTFERWRAYLPTMTDGTSWTGPLFSWTVPSHNPDGRRTFRLVPWPDEPADGEWEMWRYRRIVDAHLHLDPEPPDVTVINMVQMDYWQAPLLGVGTSQQLEALAGAREQSLCWLYWMQTEAPRHDGRGGGYPGLRLRGDELGTSDGFAKAVYVRESRRLRALTVVHEGHIGTEQRAGMGHSPERSSGPDDMGIAEPFTDSVGIGHYMIDLHPSCAGRNNIYVRAAPFRIPLGSLVPVRVRNLLAAGKCLGVSHIANGCYRMHHVEWNVGESAGLLAAWCLENRRDIHAAATDADLITDVQRLLVHQGVRLSWPWES